MIINKKKHIMNTFSINSTEINNKLVSVGRAIVSRSTIPVLDNFLFQLNQDKLKITGSDSEVFIQTSLQVETDKFRYAYFMIGASTLLEALKEVPECILNFELNDTHCIIHYPNGLFQLPILDAQSASYPVPVQFKDDDKTFSVSSSDLLSVSTSLTQFTCQDNSRPIMTGIHTNILEGHVEFVASNMTSLALFEFTAENQQNGTFTMSQKTAAMLGFIIKKHIPKQNENVTVKYNASHAQFEVNDFIITARLIDGKFPNYKAIFPKSTSSGMVVDKDAMTAAVKRCLVFSNQVGQIVIEVKENSMTIQGQDVDLSQSSEEHLDISYSGPTAKMAFKGNMILSILKCMEDSMISFNFNDNTKPFIIYPTEQNKCYKYIFLLMPNACD